MRVFRIIQADGNPDPYLEVNPLNIPYNVPCLRPVAILETISKWLVSMM